MTETTPEQPKPGNEPTPQPPDDPTPPAPPEQSGTGRFAVYDETIRQYVGGVVDKRPTKAEARKLVREGHDFTVKEV